MRSGFVGLAGRPNVGKSTLTNALTGAHVAIVSDKPQTTRQRALGVVHGDDYQIVLVDLPGFQRPFDALTRRMQRSVDDGLRDVDAVLLVLDASEASGGGDRFIAEQLAATGAPVVIALNKVDRLKPAAILEAINAVSGLVERLRGVASRERAQRRRHPGARGRAGRRCCPRGRPISSPGSIPTSHSSAVSQSSCASRRSRARARRCRMRSR